MFQKSREMSRHWQNIQEVKRDEIRLLLKFTQSCKKQCCAKWNREEKIGYSAKVICRSLLNFRRSMQKFHNVM